MTVTQGETPTDKDEVFRGGRYASTEGELYEKAIALLEKCKIEPGRSGRQIPESEPAA